MGRSRGWRSSRKSAPRDPHSQHCPKPKVGTPVGQSAMCAAPLAAAALAAAAPRSVYSFSARPLAGGEPMSLGSLRGKVLLIENVASL